MKLDDAFLKLKREHKDAMVALIHAAVARPNAMPAFIMLMDKSKHELQAIPIGEITMSQIIKMCKMVADPNTEKFERTIFTNDRSEN